MSRVRTLAGRVVAGSGLGAVRGLQRRVELLEDAVAENAALEAALEPRIAELEARLLGVAEARSRGKRHTPTAEG